MTALSLEFRRAVSSPQRPALQHGRRACLWALRQPMDRLGHRQELLVQRPQGEFSHGCQQTIYNRRLIYN